MNNGLTEGPFIAKIRHRVTWSFFSVEFNSVHPGPSMKPLLRQYVANERTNELIEIHFGCICLLKYINNCTKSPIKTLCST